MKAGSIWLASSGRIVGYAMADHLRQSLVIQALEQRRFQTRQQAIAQITEYIELFYNRQRLQARLGYLSPAAFEQRSCQSQLGKT